MDRLQVSDLRFYLKCFCFNLHHVDARLIRCYFERQQLLDLGHSEAERLRLFDEPQTEDISRRICSVPGACTLRRPHQSFAFIVANGLQIDFTFARQLTNP